MNVKILPGVLLASTLVVAMAAPATAQRYESKEHGFRIGVARELEQVPLEPNERQILAKFTGRLKFKDKRYKGYFDSIVMVVRIAKNKGPTTGDASSRDEGQESQSARERAADSLNSATTLKEFLSRRGYNDDLRELSEKERAVKNKNGEVLAVQELVGDVQNPLTWKVSRLPFIRTYVVENETEIFGLVAIGPFVNPFNRIVVKMAKSLERTAMGAREVDTDYTESSLGNKDFRETVRAKLVKGWKAYDTEHYIIVTNSRDRALIKKMMGNLEVIHKVYQDRFPPVDDISGVISTVRYCASYDDYMAYGAPPGTGGYWNYRDEELVLVDIATLGKKVLKDNPNLKNIKPLDILHHEAMHQYMYYSNGNLAPASWFGEGFGEFFGGAEIDRRKEEIKRIGLNKFRMAWIKRAQRAGAWPDLRSFLKMTRSEFYGRSSLQNYAFAWAFCYFCEEEKKKRKPNLQWAAIPDNYLKHLRDATEEKREKLGVEEDDKDWLSGYENDIQKVAFERTFKDIDLKELEEAWIKAIRRW